MKNTGQILKEAREKKNLSLHEIGMSLKINPKTLQAMEEGDMSKLPSLSFLKGFVKSYASYLKLDTQEVLSIFQSETGSDKIKKPSESLLVVQSKESNTPSSSSTLQATEIKPIAQIKNQENSNASIFDNKVALSIAGLITIVLIVGVGRLVEKYQKERQIDNSQIQVIQSNAQLTQDGEQPVKTETASETVEKNSDSAPVDSNKDLTKIITPQPTQPTQQQSTNTLNQETAVTQVQQKPSTQQPAQIQQADSQKTTTVVPKTNEILKPETAKPAATAQTTNKPVEQPKELQKDPQKILKPTEVIIEALNKVTINYNLGDGKNKTVELSADQFHTFKSQTLVELDISDGGAVNLIVNGRDRGVPGTIGKSIKLTYPKQ